jgi:UDP-N-acetyl-D-mannosaminuronate dehydrogenase
MVNRRLLLRPCALILGDAYRANSADIRNSPSFVLGMALEDDLFAVRHCDPVVRPDDDWRKLARGADVAILMTGHDAFREIDLCKLAGLMRQKNLVDGRRFFDGEAARAAGFNYYCVGVGR